MPNKLVLVINCGSSSLKFSIINPESGDEHLSGLAECLYLPNTCIHWTLKRVKRTQRLEDKTEHKEVLSFIINTILASQSKLFGEIFAIGHRIVHGGPKFTRSVIIDENFLRELHHLSSFAPLHTPAHIIGITETLKHFPSLSHKNVAVFDTAFHQTMPESSYLYALPYKLCKEYGIRRYGAHGTSHSYVMQEAAKFLKKSVRELHLITCHLGNGSSVAAILKGQCVDTSMGLTPLEGLVMGSRSGDIDPAIIFFLHDKLGMNIADINHMLTHESGLLGLTGVTSDCRYLENNYSSKTDAKRAMDVYCHRLAKYIASYIAVMDGRLDAIIFTGGVGENSYMVREFTLNQLTLLGVKVDHDRNLLARFGRSGFINQDNTLSVLVLPTKEELMIARDAILLTT
ncbi:Acetate kinase [Candidatus Erwinia haradaeae]|uniref:Acetate kinase n=1 Tax=Candidatus Erwinia haradaeae TaxID=1922217 RepID=A0A451DJ12_9GAMM|nr:acetate kinase [Candidatus Erwinia haradaeae]VFP86673.1 Acetate kinase [Candidatus Erwinia haradaeae]